MNTLYTFRRAGAVRLGGLLILAVAGLLAVPAARAQSKSLRIGVVDIDKIMERSVSFKSAAQKIESQLRPLRDRYESKLTERDNLRQSIRDRRSVLKPEEVAQQEEKYFAIVDEVSDINYNIEKESGRLQRELLEPVMKQLKTIIEDLAKREGYDLVLYANQLFYFSEQVDLTPQILQSLDRGEGAAAAPAPEKPAASGKATTKSKSKK